MRFKTQITYFLLFFFLISHAQTSRLTLNLNRVTGFYNKIKASVLVVPLKNEPTAEDSALIAAVTKYWKTTPFKFISEKEFDVIKDNKIKTPNNIFLIRETYERLKYSRMDWAYTKYFLTSAHYGVELMDEPFIEFKLPVKSLNKKLSLPDYSYAFGLMIKQFNYDIELMKDKENYSKIERSSLIKNNFKKELKEYSFKTMFFAQPDLDNYMMNLPDQVKTGQQAGNLISYISDKTKMDTSRIKFVTEEKIKNVILTADTNSLIYTGFSIYKASDGKMLRRIDVSSKERKKHAVYTTGLAFFITAASLVFFLWAGRG